MWVMKMKKFIILFFILTLLLTGCRNKQQKETVSNSTNSVQQEQTITTNENLINENKEVMSEEELVDYMEDVEQELDTIVNSDTKSSSTKDTLKNTYKTLTDFIFYDKKIRGKTFKELSAQGKEKILDLYLRIDQKIEKVEPNYKENISSTAKKVYATTKDKALELKEKIKNQYKEQVGEDVYNQTIDHYEEEKNNLKEAYAPYEPAVETVKDKAKETYNNAKDKVSSWWNKRK